MAEITKQALKVDNNQSFPNNNNGAITPSILRAFNTNMIDSMVDEIGYNLDSGSWNQQIDALEQFTASASGLTTGSLLITASAVSNVITFTKGNGSTFNVTVADTTDLSSLNAFTASATISLNNLNLWTSSYQPVITNLQASQSIDSTKFTTIGTQSGSWDNTNLNAYTASNDTKWNTLGALSGSFVTESETGSFARTNASNTFTQANTFTSISASSFISASEFVGNGSKITGITASISMPILDEGIPQGNAFSLNFTGSGISAIVVGGTAVISVNTPDSGTINNLTASFNAYTSSTNLDLAAIHQATASLQLFTSSFSTSSLVSTSSFNQYTQSNDQRVSSLEAATASLFTSASLAIVTASVTNDDITFTKGDGSQFTISVATGSYAETSSITNNVVVIARNGGTSTLGAGTVVHITSAVGDNPIFTTASFDTEALSSNTFGLLRYSSPAGADVQVVVSGIVTGVNTDPVLGYAAGDIIYLSSSGQFTRVQPQAPNQIVTLGQVLRAQQNNGSIYVSINNGWELNELHNVQINTPLTGDLLQYESSSYGLWKNKSIEGAGITSTSSFNAYTSSNDAKVNSLISTTGSYATTGSNSFNGNQIITGSVTISGSSTTDLTVVGQIFVSSSATGGTTAPRITVSGSAGTSTINRNNISTRNTTNSATLSPTVIYVSDLASTDEIGFSVEAAAFPNWTFGPGIYVNNPTDTYPAIFGFQDKANYTDGRVTVLTPLSASAGFTASLQNGYAWVGNSLGQNTQVATSSFGTAINTGSFITTGSATTASQTIFGDFKFNTTYVANAPVVAQDGGTNILYIDYSIFGGAYATEFGYWNNNGYTGVTVNGTGVTNATVTSTGYGTYLELTLSTGTVTNGATYTFSGPAIQVIDITGSLSVNNTISVSPVNGNSIYMDSNGFSATSTTFGGALNPGIIQLRPANSNDIFQFAASSSAMYNGGGQWSGPQIAGYTNDLGDATIIGFQTDTSWTDGRVTILRPLIAQSGSVITGSLIVSNTFTASLANGYTWVGNGSNKTTLVATSSFGSSIDTGSLMRTGSVAGNVLTFTKGDATTFSLTVATGSAGGAAFPYTGDAVISGSLQVTGSFRGYVSALSVVSSTASIDMVNGNFFTLNLPTSSTTHIAITNIKAGQTINLQVSQSSANTGSIAFAPNIKFAGGYDYTATAITGALDLVSFIAFDANQILATSVKNLL